MSDSGQIHPLYIDFVRFLEELTEETSPWPSYEKLYLTPHLHFLQVCWKTVNLSPEMVRDRVRRIKRSDYSELLAMVHRVDLGKRAAEVLKKCSAILPGPIPDVYLFVGFFSSDGFVVDLQGRWVIGIGLERFHQENSFGCILAHEYCHYYLRSKRITTETIEAETIFTEGASFVFSQLVYPDEPLYRHLFYSRSRFNTCLERESATLRLIGGRTLHQVTDLLANGDNENAIPPRVGNYISYRLVKDFMKEQHDKDLTETLGRSDLVQSWNLYIADRLNLSP